MTRAEKIEQSARAVVEAYKIHIPSWCDCRATDEAMPALRAALAAPQEPPFVGAYWTTRDPKKILAWWFCDPDADGVVRLPHGDGRVVTVGETLSVEGEIVACRSGLHASVRPLNALQYAPGAMVCRVEVWGGVKEEEDKIAGRNRRVLWMADADRALRLFACDCAEEACRVANHTDERSLNAIRVARLYAEGRATVDELAAAWAAARDAAWAAASAAAWAAARDAASAAARDAQNEALEKRLLGLAPKESK